MIASLKGTLLVKEQGHLVVEVGGVGYRVVVSTRTAERLPAVGAPVTLHIHTAVREDDISLYGFLEATEQALFERLITVNGVGCRSALTILSGMEPAALIEAIRREDLVRLTSISGIGKKTAERMIVDLKDKLLELSPGPIPATGRRAPLTGPFEEVLSALTNLGYQRVQAEQALRQLDWSRDIPLETAIKEALRLLSR